MSMKVITIQHHSRLNIPAGGIPAKRGQLKNPTAVRLAGPSIAAVIGDSSLFRESDISVVQLTGKAFVFVFSRSDLQVSK